MKETQQLVLVSGVPGTGKSFFGRWCAAERGCLHLDLEHADLNSIGMNQSWSEAVMDRPGAIKRFVDGLRVLERSVILDWGYPPAFLPLVRRLHEAGGHRLVVGRRPSRSSAALLKARDGARSGT